MGSDRPSGNLRERLLAKPGSRVDLGAIAADETFGHQHADAEAALAQGIERLAALQERLWAGASHAILVVLQGMDTAGKDGAIGHVMTAFNPQGCQVVGFKVPTAEEAAHDFLWRVHRSTPAKGSITIFNRSHYEEVLIVRVHELVPKSVWERRYDAINAFERTLAECGTTIVKFFLHISKDEQRRRLQERIDTPDKQWKFRQADLVERRNWDAYQEAYRDALERCSTEVAPWYVIPADHKWFRNLAVAEILADEMEALDLRYPDPEPGIRGLVVE